MRLTPEPLQDRWVRLEPIAPEHRDALRAAADDPAIWRWFPDRGDGAHFDALFEDRLAKARNGAWIVFTVVRQADQAVVGQTCWMAIEPAHQRVEIGGTWYAPAAQASAVNPAAKRLLLSAAFAAGALRVELKTDALNARSRAAILKLGAQEEGILRRHTRMWDGRMRDTVYFSVLDHEWPAVEARLRQRLEQA